MPNDTFSEYRLKILGDLQRQNETLIKLQDIVTIVATDVTELKVAARMKTVFYGALGGSVVVIISAITMFGKLWQIWGK